MREKLSVTGKGRIRTLACLKLHWVREANSRRKHKNTNPKTNEKIWRRLQMYRKHPGRRSRENRGTCRDRVDRLHIETARAWSEMKGCTCCELPYSWGRDVRVTRLLSGVVEAPDVAKWVVLQNPNS
ncbi:hypothetical protein RRG08_052784 [Elysia crispata]|uniref:Uncharacterized protein n=1 Tax=Elysia crispata TaxID=231223 RepID=A0AAE1EAK6_9GAST|nr:hypothetical protein RRG08_052784 [Elysia crispata]